MTYAGFWRRTGAFCFDSFFLLLLFSLFLGPQYSNPDFWSLEGLITNSLTLILTVALWVKFLGTPGKLLLCCQVVDADTGCALSVKQAVIRYLGYYVSIFTLFIGFLWIIWDKRKQGFHDKIANTVVLYNEELQLDDESQKSLEQLMGEVR